MCGICGEVNFRSNSMCSEEILSRMADSMNHRGPDDKGVYVCGQVGLGHTRLSIIDLSAAGHQPMSNEDGTVWITYNGEFYNYMDWVPWLEEKGHIFKSRTDSEVIIHLYEEKGTDFLQCINGMFALAIWDDRKKQILLARDRIGVKPLVYARNGNQLIFASEIKALLQRPDVSRDIDLKAVELYFSFNFIPAPWTIYRQIRKLPQSHYLLFNAKSMQLARYWKLPQEIRENIIEEEACEFLRGSVQDATKIRLRSDVPLGAFLSGGIDSGIVVAAMARVSDRPVNTFFIRHGEDPLFDETRYAGAVAEMYGTRHTNIEVSPNSTLEMIPGILSSFDEPFADSSAVPTFIVSKMTRKHVKVALSGDGGDEIFAGYRRYLAEIYIQYYLVLPQGIREKIIGPLIQRLPESKGEKLLEYFRRIKIFVSGAGGDPAQRHYSWLAYFPDKDRHELLGGTRYEESKNGGRGVIKELYDSFEGADSINRMLFADHQNLLVYDMLNKVDWMSMKNGLEVRSPLLDFRVSELAFGLSGKLKIKGSRLKYILKKAFAEWLPEGLQNRPKQGFEIPIGEWFKRSKPFRKLFWDTIGEDKSIRGPLFNQRKIGTLFEEHVSNSRDNSHKLWAILVFHWWYHGAFGPGK